MTVPEALTVTAYIDGSPVNISDQISKLSFGTIMPGGDAECQFTVLKAGSLSDGDLMRLATRILISDSSSWKWLGRLEQIGGEYWSGGANLNYVARGYASSADDQIYINETKWESGKNVYQIFHESCQALCPDILSTPATLPRVIRENTQDFIFATAKTVWNMISALGDGSAPLIWEVYSLGNEDAGLTIRIRPLPGVVTYYASMANGVPLGITMTGGAQVSLIADLQAVRNSVSVKYRDERAAAGYRVLTVEGGSSWLEDTTRMIGIDLNRLALRNITAVSYAAEQMLAQLASPQNGGRQIVLPYPCTVLTNEFVTYGAVSSTPVPLWQVRAGHVIEVLDLNSGAAGIDNTFLILSTNWDEDARTQTLTCGPVR